MTTTHYRVMISHRTRDQKDFPLAHDRHTVYAPNAVSAATLVLGQPRVVALGDLFVSLAVSRVGTAGTKG